MSARRAGLGLAGHGDKAQQGQGSSEPNELKDPKSWPSEPQTQTKTGPVHQGLFCLAIKHFLSTHFVTVGSYRSHE